MTEFTLIKNVRPAKVLFADAPANFTELANEARLAFIEEATEAGTRYVIDFDDLSDARQDHLMVR